MEMDIKQGIPEDKRLEAITWAYEYFKKVINKDDFLDILAEETNWDISAMLIQEDKILGLYLLGNTQISMMNDITKINLSEYEDMYGVEGILLAVDLSIRGQGWGNKLKDYPSTLGFDYIWGQQFKSLNNLQDWLKRRVLVAETKYIYVTAEKYLK